MRVPIRKRLAPGRTQKSLQIPIMRCSAVASLLAYFFSRRQARSRFYRALLAGISNALPLKATGLYRFYLQLITDFWGRILVRRAVSNVMRRIVVFGNSGSGKTTLARVLTSQYGLAHLDLDSLAWDSPGVQVQTMTLDDWAAFVPRRRSL